MGRLLALIVAVSLLTLAGCGVENSSSSSSVTSTAKTQTATLGTAPKLKQQARQQEQQKPKPTPAPKLPSGPVPTDPDPLPNQGQRTVAPDVPTAPGGDNSIQRYGVESQRPERIEAALVVQAYLQAQAQGRWEEACSYLNAKVHSGLEGLARSAKDEGIKGCAGAMATLLAKQPQGVLQKAADIQVLSFRVDGDQGFVVYRDAEGNPYNLLLSREGGQWRVGALIGVALLT